MRGSAPLRCHIWTTDVPPGLDGWDPDAEPSRFTDGRSHSLFELFVRLRERGHPVTIGPHPAVDATSAVVFAKDLDLRTSWRALWRLRRLPLVVIESDWRRWRSLPLRPALLVRSGPPAPSRARVVEVPLLPQRGLVRRRQTGVVRTLCYMGDAAQAPRFWSTTAFHDAVREVGVEVRDAAGPTLWHDFSGADVVLCMRRAEFDTSHKPPTKLVNAWAAGAVPLVGPEAAYRSLGRHEVDCLFVDDDVDVLAALQRLGSEPTLASTLEEGVRRRQVEFSPDAVLDRWEAALSEVPVAALPRWRFAAAVGHWLAAQCRNAVVNRHPPSAGGSHVRSGR